MKTSHESNSLKLTLTVKEAAAALGVGVNNAYELVRSGRIRSVRVGRRLIIPKQEILDFLARESAFDQT